MSSVETPVGHQDDHTQSNKAQQIHQANDDTAEIEFDHQQGVPAEAGGEEGKEVKDYEVIDPEDCQPGDESFEGPPEAAESPGNQLVEAAFKREAIDVEGAAVNPLAEDINGNEEEIEDADAVTSDTISLSHYSDRLKVRQQQELVALTEQRNRLEDMLRQARAQKERLLKDRDALEARTAQWIDLEKKKNQEGEKPGEEGVAEPDIKVTDHKYVTVLHSLHSARLGLREQEDRSTKAVDDLRAVLEDKKAKVAECRDALREFKRQVARNSEYVRSGKKIPLKVIQEVEDFELDKNSEVEEARGAHITLKNRLTKLEEELRKKDQLAEGLHLIGSSLTVRTSKIRAFIGRPVILAMGLAFPCFHAMWWPSDFEQLKIENQTLSEKIEERQEQVQRLKKKTVTTIQVLAHMREKMQFLEKRGETIHSSLAELDKELVGQRDLLAKTKHDRDEYRTENDRLRQQAGIVDSKLITKDHANRKARVEELKEIVAALHENHERLLNYMAKR
ncbi:coiled-coil domain containing 96 [Perkinsus olseni]|uniref:Coiled-coil domain containing 96 n=1 Tax=Perkinsus olseni TaxID=32597 RepID=A0A7J6UG79_PEROL|nr:coiled-coil domain containing 96 [Perkinsus olseni]